MDAKQKTLQLRLFQKFKLQWEIYLLFIHSVRKVMPIWSNYIQQIFDTAIQMCLSNNLLTTFEINYPTYKCHALQILTRSSHLIF